THDGVHFLHGRRRAIDWPDLAALAAPRDLLVLQCGRDRLFPPAGMRVAVEKIAAIYTKAGVMDRFVGHFHDGPHIFSRGRVFNAFSAPRSAVGVAGSGVKYSIAINGIRGS